MAAADAGMAAGQMLLAGVDEGLGVGLNTPNPEHIHEVLGVPEEWMMVWVLLVGYPAESWDAGGQRPASIRRTIFEGNMESRSKEAKVVDSLKR